MDEQNEIIVLESQAPEEPNQFLTPATTALIEEGAKHSVNLIIEDYNENEIVAPSVEASSRKKRHRSLVRVYLRRFRRMRAKVHPLDRPVSPQLLVKDGKMQVWNPDLMVQGDKEDDEEQESRSLFGCCKFNMNWQGNKNKEWIDEMFSHSIKTIEVGFGSGVASIFKFMRWVVIHNLLLFLLWGLFLILPTAVSFDYSMVTSTTFKAENLLDGNGPIQYMWFFFGAYPPKKFNYRIDAAYVIIALLTYFGTLFMLLRSIAKTDVPMKGSPFSLLLFASCNFSIGTTQEKSALLMDMSVNAKDLLSEAKTKEEARNRVKMGKYKLLLGRGFAWIISIVLTAVACVAIYYFLTKVTVAEFIASQTNVQVGQEFLKNNGLSLVFSFINIAFPAIITKLVKLEGYAKVTSEIRVNVIRVFSLRFISVVVLMITLYTNVTSASFKGCGGTFIGQEFYKIIIFDIVFVQTIRFVFKSFLGILRKEKQEPDVAALLLQVVYRQALIWSGTFFCPFMSFLGLLSQVLVFYSNYWLVSYFCKAPSKRFRNVGTTSFYKACMVVTLSILLIPAVTVLGSQYVSIGVLKTIETLNSTCGPFMDRPPFEVLKDITGNKQNMPDWLYKTYNWLTSAAVFPVFLVLSTIIYIQTVRLRKQTAKFRALTIDHNKFKMKTNARLIKVTKRQREKTLIAS